MDGANRRREHECEENRLEPGKVALTVLPWPDQFHDEPSDMVPPGSIEAYCKRATQSSQITKPIEDASRPAGTRPGTRTPPIHGDSFRPRIEPACAPARPIG